MSDKLTEAEVLAMEEAARQHLAPSAYSESDKEEWLIPLMGYFGARQVARLSVENEALKGEVERLWHSLRNVTSRECEIEKEKLANENLHLRLMLRPAADKENR